MQLQLQQKKAFPSGGWGPRWVGDADRGSGADQPGGWVYNLLPYMEQVPLHDRGLGATGLAKQTAVAQLVSVTLAYMNCPTRRGVQTYPTGSRPASRTIQRLTVQACSNITASTLVTKGDYAANAGIGSKLTGTATYSEDALGTGGCSLADSEYPNSYAAAKTIYLGQPPLERSHLPAQHADRRQRQRRHGPHLFVRRKIYRSSELRHRRIRRRLWATPTAVWGKIITRTTYVRPLSTDEREILVSLPTRILLRC